MSLPTPVFLTMEEYRIFTKHGENVLPAESFVREISDYYLPKHIKEEDDKKGLYDKFNPETQVWVYCHYGIVAIPKRILRKGN